MKTLNTIKILAKAIDIELKKTLQRDLESFRAAQSKKQNISQGNQQAT
ncbi:hypothetical protein MUGA111182_03045 [Mucilaginibacter galii]|uniref:Uncharacterized protein n=1 Tax=Mucilaginibacter galii TaxID=2005073 RepID=A0A917JA98_9SPHI|nr:hypothetical protein [Mucilaginibacter galii]GGI50366.1 hypothetical protein GCM10011425_15780 [Mucilaginibacter galii]